MALTSVTTIMPLLLRITAGDFFERVKAGIGWKEKRCIYSFGVVLTLMILQRATGRKTLSRTVGLAVAVADGEEGGQRLRGGARAANTGERGVGCRGRGWNWRWNRCWSNSSNRNWLGRGSTFIFWMDRRCC